MADLDTYTVTLDDGSETTARIGVGVRGTPSARALLAAEIACQRWNERGEWSGDPIPDPCDVLVAAPDGSRWRVSVDVEWSPSFTAATAEEVTHAE